MNTDLSIMTLFYSLILLFAVSGSRAQETNYDYNFNPDESYDPGEPQDPTVYDSEESSPASYSYTDVSSDSSSSESDDYDYTASSGDQSILSPEESYDQIVESLNTTTTENTEEGFFGDKFIQIAICVGTVFGVTLAVIFVYFIVRTVQSDDKKCEEVLNECNNNNQDDPENPPEPQESEESPQEANSETKIDDPLLKNSESGPKNPFGDSKEDLLET